MAPCDRITEVMDRHGRQRRELDFLHADLQVGRAADLEEIDRSLERHRPAAAHRRGDVNVREAFARRRDSLDRALDALDGQRVGRLEPVIRQGEGTAGEDDRIDADGDRIAGRRRRDFERQAFLDLGKAEHAALRDHQVDSRAITSIDLIPTARGPYPASTPRTCTASHFSGVEPVTVSRSASVRASRSAGELRREALLPLHAARDFSLRARLPGENLEWKELAHVGLRHGQVEAVERDVHFELNGLHADPAARFHRAAPGKRRRGDDAKVRARAGREALERQLHVVRGASDPGGARVRSSRPRPSNRRPRRGRPRRSISRPSRSPGTSGRRPPASARGPAFPSSSCRRLPAAPARLGRSTRSRSTASSASGQRKLPFVIVAAGTSRPSPSLTTVRSFRAFSKSVTRTLTAPSAAAIV